MTNDAINPGMTNNTTTARSSDIFQIYLADENGQSILSIDDGAKRQSLRVEIVNTSGQAIILKDTEGNFLTNYHFCISFRPGTLIAQGKDVTLTVQDGQGKTIDNWQIEQDDNDEVFFLRLNKPAAETAKAIKAGGRITLVLGNIGAAPAGGARGTRVEIRLSNLQYIGQKPENSPQDIPNQTRLHYLNIVNQRGRKQVPLYAGFLGSNTILNDGSENELTLTIQMLPQASTPLRIQDSSVIKLPSQQPIDYTTLTGREEIVFDAIAKGLEILPRVLANSLKITHSVADIPNAATKLPDAVKTLLGQQTSEETGETLSLVSEVDLQVVRSFFSDLGLENAEPYQSILNNLKVISHDPERVNRQSLKLPKIETVESFDEAVRFTISFDVATTDDSRYWALVEKSEADDIQISIAQGQENWVFGGKFEQGITPQWSFVCKKSLQLTDRQEILRLSIKNLKTQLLSGYANLYVHYENFPGYWDGFITVPIHKGPLVYRECEDVNKVKIGCVGIGTDEPKAKLHVKSAAGVVGLRVEGDAAITGKLSVSDTNTLTGKVGIGSDPGTERLKVQGDTAILGNLSVSNGKFAIGSTTLDKEPLVIRAQGTQQGLIAFEDPNGTKKWHLEQNFSNNPGLNFAETKVADCRLFLKAGGNVGIGTGNPQDKLHIQDGAIHISNGPYTLRIGIDTKNDNRPYFYLDGPDFKGRGFYIDSRTATLVKWGAP